jgi:hypothetical protein
MSNSQEIIEKLKDQIAFLTAELNRVEQKSNSLWSQLQDAFLQEGNDSENADFWADRISQIFSTWVHNQRTNLTQRIMSTGVMPPYTDCLNDLVVSISPPGSAPPSLPPEFVELVNTSVVGPTQLSPGLDQPAYQGLSADAQVGPPKQRKIGVPKPIPGAVPLPLPPLTEQN